MCTGTSSGMKRSLHCADLRDMEDTQAGVGMLVQKLSTIHTTSGSESPKRHRISGKQWRAPRAKNPATAALEKAIGDRQEQMPLVMEMMAEPSLFIFSAEAFMAATKKSTSSNVNSEFEFHHHRHHHHQGLSSTHMRRLQQTRIDLPRTTVAFSA